MLSIFENWDISEGSIPMAKFAGNSRYAFGSQDQRHFDIETDQLGEIPQQKSWIIIQFGK